MEFIKDKNEISIIDQGVKAGYVQWTESDDRIIFLKTYVEEAYRKFGYGRMLVEKFLSDLNGSVNKTTTIEFRCSYALHIFNKNKNDYPNLIAESSNEEKNDD